MRQSASSTSSGYAWSTGTSPISIARSMIATTLGSSIETPWNLACRLTAATPSSSLQRRISSREAAPKMGSPMHAATGKRPGFASRYLAIPSFTTRVSAIPLLRR